MTAPTDNPYAASSGSSPERPADNSSGEFGGYPAPPRPNNGRGFTIAAFVLAVLSLAVLPIVLGPIGAVLGFVGNRKGDPKGKVAGVLAIICTVVGMVVGAVVMTELRG